MKNRVTLLIIIFVMFISSNVTAVASNKSSFNTIDVKGVLYTTQESVLDLPNIIIENEVIGISLSDERGKIVATTFTFEGNQLHVSPINNLVGEINYTLKIFSKNNKRYQAKLKALDFTEIDDSKISIIKISANPDKGFNYPYYLLIPEGTRNNPDAKYLVVEPNNTGYPSDSMKVHETSVKIFLHDYGHITSGAGGYQVSTELKTPLLMPVFPRPTTEDGAGIYVHALDKEAITAKGVKYERPDLQLIAMIKDAKKLLLEKGIELEEKVLMTGFSASGDFVNRFMFLHPKMVKAVASSSSTIFPASEYEGVKLNYPLGVTDMNKLFGIKFNAKEFNKIAKYIYRGDQDGNDFTQDWDKNGEDYVKVIRKLFKDETQPYKWNRKIEIMKDLGYNDNYQYHTYKGIGHNISYNMHEDIVAFFKANLGEEFNRITPHEFAE